MSLDFQPFTAWDECCCLRSNSDLPLTLKQRIFLKEQLRLLHRRRRHRCGSDLSRCRGEPETESVMHSMPVKKNTLSRVFT